MRPAVTCAIVFLCHFTSASNSSSTLVLGCAPKHRRRFDHRDDVLMVYLRRIRKAGSTTIFRGLQHFFNTSGRLQADEQNPINGRCVVTEVSHLKTGWNRFVATGAVAKRAVAYSFCDALARAPRSTEERVLLRWSWKQACCPKTRRTSEKHGRRMVHLDFRRHSRARARKPLLRHSRISIPRQRDGASIGGGLRQLQICESTAAPAGLPAMRTPRSASTT